MRDKLIKILTIIVIALISVIGISQLTVDVKAGTAYNEYVAYNPKGGMVFSGGNVVIVTKAKKASSTSTYKYRTIGWNLTVTRNGLSKYVYVQLNDTSGNSALDTSAVTKYQEERVENKVTYYYTSYHVKQSWLESKTGLDLDTGSVSIKANARMQAYNAKTGQVYSTNNSWANWSRNLGWAHNTIKDAFKPYKSNYYDVSVTQVTYKLNVYAGTGVASTSGSGWYAPGTKVTYAGTAKAGYNTPTGGTYTMGYGNKDITLTATPKTYTIYYNGNGSTSGSVANSTATYNSSFRTNKNAFARVGYRFNGWKDSAGKVWGLSTAGVYESGKWATYTYASNTTMYAQWTPYIATLYFNVNGGGINSSTYKLKNSFVCKSDGYWATGSINYDTTSMDLWNVGTFGLYKTGYHVDDADAWRVGSATGPAIPQSSTTNATYLNYLKNYIKSGDSGIYLYANWKPNVYTVTYNANGGSGSMSSSSVTYNTEFITRQNTFTRSGYTFKGWNTAADGSGTWWTANTAGTYENGNKITWAYTNNITLYAQWEPNTYQITIDPYGGTMKGFNGVSTTDPVTRNNVFDSITTFCTSDTTSYSSTAVSQPVRDGYEFNGWKVVSSGGTITKDANGSYQIAHTYAGNITLQAKWKGVYKVTLNPNGGTIYEVTTTRKSGVTFDYAAAQYYAYATNNKFTVTKTTDNIDEDGTAILDMYISGRYYNYKGSIISMSHNYYDTFLKRGLSYGIPPIPIRDGYTFNAWSASSGAILSTQERTIETNKYIGYYCLYSIAGGVNEVTLTAQWTPNKYKIIFDPNGGEVSTKSKTAKTGSTLGTLPTPTHSDSSKQFIGWCYPSVPSEPTDKSNLVYSTTVFNYNKDITLYALWDDKRLDLKYSNNGGALTDEASEQGYIITYDNEVVLGEKITDSTGSTITQPIYDYKYYRKSLHDNDEPYATELRHPEDYFYKTGYHIDDNIAWKIYNDSSYTYFPACEDLSSVQNEFLDHLIEQGITAKTLRANWQANKYNIIYAPGHPTGETNPITGAMAMDIGLLYDTSYNLSGNLYRLEGYEFAGWKYYDDNGDEQILQDFQSFKNLTAKHESSVVLYTQWKPCEYNVTFDATGGNVEVGAKTVVFNTAYGELPTPTRDGYTFSHWVLKNDENSTETTIKADSIVRTASDHTLYAVWTPNKYTVYFNPNGGTVTTTSKIVTFDEPYGTLPTPTRAGYTFVGWAKTTTIESIEDEIITEITLVKTPNDHTLYAIWEPNKYNVYFNDNGGVCSTAYKQVTYTKEYGELPVATRDGYTFVGWFTSATGGTQVLSTTIVTKMEDHTVYAHWTPNKYKIYFNPNGGTCTTEYKEVTYDSKYGELPTATHIEHKFIGWYTAKIGGEQITASTIVKQTSDITVYARWDSSLDFYIVTNKADVQVEPFYIKDDDYLYYSYTDETTNVTTYNKMYYTYYYTDEWMRFDNPDGLAEKTGYHIIADQAYYMDDGTIIPADVDITSDNEYSSLITKFMTMIKPDKIESTTIYMNWQQNKYSVVYDSNKPDTASNNIAGTMSKSNYTYDVDGTLRKNSYSLTGWTFKGWNTESDGTGTAYADAQVVKNLTSEKDGVVTLYAQWQPNPYAYNIVYKSSTGIQIGTGTVTHNFDTTNEIAPKSFSGYTSPESQTIVWNSVTAKTITFIYEPIVYTVTIVCNGGTGVSNLEYTIESADFTLGKPNYTGYTFTGWTGTNGTTPQTEVTIKKGSIGNRNYKANWRVNTYTVVYNNNKPESASGTISQTMSNSVFTYNVKGNLTNNKFSLTGWTFTGWNTKADGTGTSYSDGTDVLNWTSVDKKVITLYAQWKANTYTIVYDKNKPSNASNEISGTMANSKYTYDVTSVLRTNTYKLTGWTFTGWNTKADGTGTTYLDKANISNCTSADGTIITLYAQWRAHTYTIKYDKNIQDTASHDITGTMADSVYTYDIESKLRTNTYSLVGWTFKGWNTKADGSGTTYKDGVDVLNWTSVDKKVITLYAQWEANTYTINYDANNKSTTPNNIYGNEFTTEPTGTTNSTSATYDSTVKLATNGFSRVGYTFKGWNTQSDSKGTMYTSGQILDKPNFITGVSGNNSTTLYAIWEPITYTVKFDRGLTNDSKNPVPTTMTLRFDQNEKWPGIGDIKGRKYTLSFDVNKPSNATSTPNPSSVATRTDYLAYAGNWALTNADYESKVGDAGESSSSFKNLRSTPGEVTATAEWTPKVLDNYTALTLEGWKFNGWYTEKTGGNRQTTITVSGNTKEYIQTLYANWTANTYTVVYNSNKPSNASGSISGTMSNSSHTYDIDSPLNSNKYSLVGWSFVSWNTQADGKGKTVTTGYNLTTVDGGVVNLYAIWRAHTYTVNYHINKSEAGTYGGSTESSKHTYDTAKNLTANGYWVYNTITFDANKVTDSDGKGTTEVTLTKKSATGYRKFIGWIQNKTTGDKTHDDKQSVINLTAVDNGVINMYAKWGTSKITLGSASRDGYTFSCWLDSNGNKYNANTEYEFTKDTTLYAQWVQNGYNIVYDKNDTVYNIYGDKVTTKATGSTPGTLAKFDDNVKLAANGFTKVGYKFKGWSIYKDWKTGDPADRLFESGATLKPGQFTGGTYTGGFTASNGSTVTLYAIWEPITYEVRFNGNGNWNTSQGSYTQTLTYDKLTALETNKFTRLDNTTYNGVFYKVGYEFLGWGKSQTQTTPTYTDRQEVFNLTATDGEIIDLYAIWRKTVTLTIDFNGGKFNNNAASEVLEYTMYNNELNHSFDIKKYYGTQKGLNYYSKGLNNNVTKTLSGVQQRFLGYNLSKEATIPDAKFDVYAVTTRIEDYIISDNTTLYAVYEPVLQMTVSLSTLESHLKEIKVDKDITIANELGNFIVLSGTTNTSLPNNVTALTSNKAIGINVLNSGVVNYKVSAKGNSDITFKMAADNRILDIYTNGLDNIWYDNLNKVTDFNYTIEDFSSLENTFTIPKYLGTQRSYQTSNPNSSDNSIVYGIKFTCTQPSYYYRKYWNTDESISIYGILFLEPSEITGDNKADSDDMSQYSDFYLQTILN